MARKAGTFRNYKEDLLKRLVDPTYAAGYLDAALEDEDPQVFLLALRDVAEARGLSDLAAEAEPAREAAFLMLSEQGNPQLSSLHAILQTLGLRLTVQPK